MAVEKDIQVVRPNFRGTISLPGEPAFEAAGKVWALSPLKPPTSQPAVVFSPKGTQDVQTALKFAQEHNLEVAVKSGGHCPRGSSWPDGGAVIDLSLMRSVFVDPNTCTAVAEGGCLLGDIDNETALHNLMVPLGHAPITGMGLVVNGGIGVASKVFGATCDHLTAVQLVTADGTVVTADKDHHSDLFWAVCGAGSAFGVITKLTFRLHKVPDTFYGGLVMWKDDPEGKNFMALTRFLRDVGIPNPNLSFNIMRMLHPEAGPTLASMVVYFGDDSVEKKAEVLQPFVDMEPFMNTLGQNTYGQVQSCLMGMFGHMSLHYEYWASAQWSVAQATDEAARQFRSQVIDNLPADKLPLTFFLYDSACGPAMFSSKAPIGMSKAGVFIGVIIGWLDPAYNQDGIAFGKYCKGTMAKLGAATNTYSNFSSEGLQDENGGADALLIARVGGKANLARLRALKQHWDPKSVFVNNPFMGM